MGTKYCMPRNVLYVVYILQLISTAERQIFDFLGYMWLPILANFFNIIFVIFGIFGLYQYRSHYLVAYTVWSLVWIGFNVFIICYYLSIGDLNADEDLLSFGTGSFSWWVVNTPGCQAHYNTTVSPGYNPLHPLRPSYVEGCFMNYENVEVTHAAIQLLLSGLGLVLAAHMVHYVVRVVAPKREKQGLKAMYSIEYSSRTGDNSNPNTLERETDLQHEMEAGQGARAAQMTPRRVKRRNRSSGRSTKSLNRPPHRASGHSHHMKSASARSSARSHKQSINPVTRLIDADQNRADSSTSNDYGQINPGFTGDQSRPNSIYNLSLNPPTDVEASRPQSTLTSYSNFHHQRRPGQLPGAVSSVPNGGLNNQNRPVGVTNLTQESLMNHDSDLQQQQQQQQGGGTGGGTGGGGMLLNCSYDDLPPPPPPLSSSPAPQLMAGDSDSGDNSSVVTAPGPSSTMPPVPQLRSSIRRNEYVNIPVQPKDPNSENAIISHQSPEPQSPGPRSSSLPQHAANYVNCGREQQQQQYGGARPRTTNPLYRQHQPDKTYINDYTAVERSQPRPESQIIADYETRISYEAETLRADTKLTQQQQPPPRYSPDFPPPKSAPGSQPPPPYYNEPYSLTSSDPSSASQRSSQAESGPSSVSGPPPPPRGYLPVPQSEPDAAPRYNPPLPAPTGYPPPQLEAKQPRPGYPEPEAGLHSLPAPGPEHHPGPHHHHQPEARSASAVPPPQPSEAAMRRIPSGGRSRDRASLRQRQRREMEARASKQSSAKQPPAASSGQDYSPGYVNTAQHNGEAAPGPEAEYGFSGGHPGQQQQLNGGKGNGYADMSGLKSPEGEDKWYLKDSMRPVGAVAHGHTCKCYRCQRKLTAI